MFTKNDLSQIKTVVRKTVQYGIKTLNAEIKAIKKSMATRKDLESMATKNDLKSMATRKDLESMATKKDLKNLEIRLVERIDDAQMEIIATVDKHKADKVKVDNIEERVDRLEDNAGLPPFPTQ